VPARDLGQHNIGKRWAAAVRVRVLAGRLDFFPAYEITAHSARGDHYDGQAGRYVADSLPREQIVDAGRSLRGHVQFVVKRAPIAEISLDSPQSGPVVYWSAD
jgi:hypothetical protein